MILRQTANTFPVGLCIHGLHEQNSENEKYGHRQPNPQTINEIKRKKEPIKPYPQSADTTLPKSSSLSNKQNLLEKSWRWDHRP